MAEADGEWAGRPATGRLPDRVRPAIGGVPAPHSSHRPDPWICRPELAEVRA
ncbi:hypothetical protein [Lentzea sp. E54]|uniref:hypothetical protein n=1 Tax=Lentzea xerophila TaxID=3435883 RepID=UPI003DA60507